MPASAASRIFGEVFSAGHRHIHQVRDAVARHVHVAELRAITQRSAVRIYRIFQLAIDETEMELWMGSNAGPRWCLL